VRGAGAVRIRCSTRADGDFHLDQDPRALDERRRRFVPLPWSQPREVHGTHVGVVSRPGDLDGAEADALVADCDDAVIGIWTGDCAPVALVAESGRFGAAHAGWRGLEAGILARAVAVVRTRDGEAVRAVLGPCIHPCCYEFGGEDLARLVERFGPGVAGRTRGGAPALDVPAAVAAALREVGVDLEDRSCCTGCGGPWFSHRARGERGRQVMAVWRPGATPA